MHFWYNYIQCGEKSHDNTLKLQAFASKTPTVNKRINNYQYLLTGMLFLALMLFNVNQITAQCSPPSADVIAPTAMCFGTQNVSLDGNGNANLDPNDLNNGSSDNCGIVSLAVSPTSVTCADIGTVNVTLTVTDVGGNTNTCITAVTVDDELPPTLTCPTNMVIDCNASTATSNTGVATATDNCIVAVAPYFTDSSTPGQCQTIIRLWRAEDDEGNVGGCSQTIEIQDTTAPTLAAAPSDITVSCDGTIAAPGASTLASSDACAGNTSIVPVDVSTQDPNTMTCNHYNYTITRTWTSTDNCSNSTTTSQTITVQDVTAPTFTASLPTVLNVPANASCMAAITTLNLTNDVADACALDASLLTTNFVVTDNSNSATVNLGAGLNANGTYDAGNYTVTYTATDVCGNVGTHVITLNIIDNVAPTAACINSTVSISVPPSGTAMVTPAMIDNGSSDNCSAVTLSVSPATVDCSDINPNTPIAVTLTVMDAGNNTATCTASLLVLDNSPPAMLCQDITVSLATTMTSISPAMIDGGSTDVCGLSSVSSTTPSMFTCADVGTNTTTLSITDANGNTGTCTATVTVEDNIAPTATCMNITANLGVDGKVAVNASELNNGSVDNCTSVSFLYSDGATVKNYDCSDVTNPPSVPAKNVTIVVSDTRGNTSSCAAIITIEDVTSPMLTCAATTVTLDANGNATVVGQDLLSGTIFMSTSKGTAGINDFTTTSSNAVIGFTFDWSYATTDSRSQERFGYLVDGVFTQLTSNTGAATQSGTATVTLAAGQSFGFRARNTDTDNNNSEVTIDNFSPLFIGDFAMANWSQTLTTSNGVAFFNDACSPIYEISKDGITYASSVTYTCADAGSVTATVRVRDVNGTTPTTCTSVITINDNQPPIAACDETVVSLGGGGSVVVNAASFNQGSMDACGGPLTYMFSIDNGTTFATTQTFGCSDVAPNTPISVVFQAADSGNNKAFCLTQLTIQDNVGPVLTCPANITVNCTTPGAATPTSHPMFTGFATAMDNCLGATTATWSDSSVDPTTPNFCETITRTWTSSDDNGNTNLCFQTITVTDSQAPVITISNGTTTSSSPITTTIECDATIPSNTPTVMDNCVGAMTPTLLSSVSTRSGSNTSCGYYNYSITRTWTATDNCNNTSTNTETIVIQDTQAPTTTMSTAMSINSSAGACGANVTGLDMENQVTDCAPTSAINMSYTVRNNAATIISTGTSNANAFFSIGGSPYTITWDFADPCGNMSTHVLTLTIVDGETPTAICRPNGQQVVLNSSGLATITPATIDNGSNDNCSIASMAVNPATFNCADIGTQTITLTVTDPAGNFNTCTTIVDVQDTSPPAITCPANIAIDCSDDINSATITGTAIATSVCGAVATITFNDVDMVGSTSTHCRTVSRTWMATNSGGSATCVQTISVSDSQAPNLTSVAATVNVTCVNVPGVSSVTATDNCSMNIGVVTANTSTQNADPAVCDHYSYTITRTYTATDECGNSTVASQTINVSNDTPVISIPANTITVGLPTNACTATVSVDLADYVTDCAADANLTFVNNAFSLYGQGNGMNSISGTYAPGTYPITLTVTDPCGAMANQSFNLVVEDNQSPSAACVSNFIVVLDNTGNGSLMAANIDAGSSDNCGAVSLSAAPTTFTTADAGSNNVTLTVTDAVGNSNTCISNVTVVPGPALFAGGTLSGAAGATVNIPVTAADFTDVQGFSFSWHLDNTPNSIGTVTGITNINSALVAASLTGFSTSSGISISGNEVTANWVGSAPTTLPANAIIFEIQVMISNAATVGQNSSLTINGTPTALNVAINSGSGIISAPPFVTNGILTVSAGATPVTLSGTIAQVGGLATDLVNVILSGGASASQQTTTTGTYSFSVAPGVAVTIDPDKDINPDNGVNILDMLAIQDHITLAASLTTDCQKIAADANGNGTIDIFDLLEIQAVITAPSTSTFSGNDSWEFVAGDCNVAPTTAQAVAPTYPGSIAYTSAQTMSNQTGAFQAIKIGDVTGDAVQGRDSDKLTFVTDELNLVAGNSYLVPLRANNFSATNGFQFTAELLTTDVIFEEVFVNELPDGSLNNFGLTNMTAGQITAAWIGQVEDWTADQVLFTISIKAQKDIALSEVFTLSSTVTEAFAVDTENELMDIAIEFEQFTNTTGIAKDGFQLLQNRPNPFNNQTVIGFHLPTASDAVLSIKDVSGKVIQQIERNYTAGYHEVEIRDLEASGIYFYELRTKNHTATRKLMYLD